MPHMLWVSKPFIPINMFDVLHIFGVVQRKSDLSYCCAAKIAVLVSHQRGDYNTLIFGNFEG